MRYRRGPLRGAVSTLAVLVLWTGCAEKLRSMPRPSLSGCGGLFTPVALPSIGRDEERALEGAVPRLSESAFHLELRRSYYRIVYDEQGGLDGESRDAFVARRLAEEVAPPGLLAGVPLGSLSFAVRPQPDQQRALRDAVLSARRPLARRLERVASRIAAVAAGTAAVTYRLDARLGINAGAEVSFRSRRILVGPSLVILAESEDALAFVMGHELAHVVHHHTMLKAAQDLFVWVLTFGYGSGTSGEAIAGILSQGSLPAFNRDKECEADYYALEYMRAAGYEPAAAAALWRKLLALRPIASRQKVPFVSERPPEAERVLRLAHWANVAAVESWGGDTSDSIASDEDGSTILRDFTPDDAIESFGVVLR